MAFRGSGMPHHSFHQVNTTVYNKWQVLRPEQWMKNLLLFLPAIFAGLKPGIPLLWNLAMGALAFSMVASAVYVINDWKDQTQDQLHPKKKHRPIAAGQWKPLELVLLLLGLLGSGIFIALFSADGVLWVLGSYFLLNLAYSFGAKHVPILDVSIIAAGFCLRMIAGGQVAQVPVTHWLLIMTFLLAMYLAFGKRLAEIAVTKSETSTRKVLLHYDQPFLQSAMQVLSAVILVAYLMYCVSPDVTQRLGSQQVYLTFVWVLLALLRMLMVLQSDRLFELENPVRFFWKDFSLQALVFIWILHFLLLINHR